MHELHMPTVVTLAHNNTTRKPGTHLQDAQRILRLELAATDLIECPGKVPHLLQNQGEQGSFLSTRPTPDPCEPQLTI